jgi:hypothetical protein
MFISHRLATQYGPALVSEPQGIAIPSDPVAALAFAIRTDREADALLAAGRFEQAERLSHAALEARCRATGARA